MDSDITAIAKEAEALMERLAPACAKISVVGEIRRRSPAAREIRLLAVPKHGFRNGKDDIPGNRVRVDLLEERLKQLQKEGILSGSENGDATWLAHSHIPARVVRTTEEAWVAMLWQTSACRDLQITVATAVRNLGLRWHAEAGGFVSSADGRMAHAVTDERQVFDVASLPYMEPSERHTWPFYPDNCSGRPLPMTPQEVGAWVKSAGWVDSRCGGEYHQFSFRRTGSPDETEFLRVCEMIRDYGYDGFYHGTKWRYLDFEGHFYFTCGSDLNITQLINRKRLRHPARPWTKNPTRIFADLHTTTDGQRKSNGRK